MARGPVERLSPGNNQVHAPADGLLPLVAQSIFHTMYYYIEVTVEF